MAYDEVLAERVRERLEEGGYEAAEKKMFGALAFLDRGNTVAGVEGDDLFVRVGPEEIEEALGRPGARPFEFRGRTSAGWVYVSGEALDDEALDDWLRIGWEAAEGLPPK
ncbi:TfoX/Sxy family protein [Streptomyces sp. AV19]|uniref:TfoX/Sxy family protein n=1 Tax=Streptomyces sp. AV19 TaxID=2793068 RepID=UPI0018FE3D1D|nr:TfoX/Sxy family protein [Streptomyces sp. AV19]MBH1933388.1 TfoX/Sxy family protein [Streptomyces sp. AV19]MDG4531999.1 TfoX/Sxy family protein [Streptomyces sp. AV19]